MARQRLYHYNRRPLTEIFSGAELVRRGLRAAHPNQVAARDDISMLFAPVPLAVIGGRYPATHPVWAPGQVIYELAVDLITIPLGAATRVIETADHTALADRLWGRVSEDEYRRQEAALEQRLGLHGQGLTYLGEQIHRFAPQTTPSFTALVQRPDFPGDLDQYYAACVPHALLTVPGHRLPVSGIRALHVPTTRRPL